MRAFAQRDAQLCAREVRQSMPGPVSESYKGTPDDAPYVPSWNYPNGPKMCPCGHDEGYHADDGVCLFERYDFSKRKARSHPRCGCTGLPAHCRTSIEELYPA
jgi:hypothetical protein